MMDERNQMGMVESRHVTANGHSSAAAPPFKATKRFVDQPLLFDMMREDRYDALGAPIACPRLSVRETLSGVSILLTGSTGYVGSLVLEQLLRCCPGISTVYVLIRDKQTDSAERRLRRVLHSGLFSHVRDQPHLLAKVCLIKGSLSSFPERASEQLQPESLAKHSPGSPQSLAGRPEGIPIGRASDTHSSGSPALGRTTDVEMGAALSLTSAAWDPEGRATRVMTLAGLKHMQHSDKRPLVVLHCAARITLEDPIKRTLDENYMGTRQLLHFARQLPGVAGFVHVSSAYVNASRHFLPEGTAREALYPFKFGEQEINHADVVARLMRLEDGLAEARCDYLCNLWGLPNSYVLGKNLTEQLVRDAHSAHMPVSIVRPSLVGALAGKPYPGYVGNLAGPSGAALAWLLGFFDQHGTALTAWNHLDCIPGDVTSSLIIAAAAALLAGYDTATDVLHPSVKGTNGPASGQPSTQNGVHRDIMTAPLTVDGKRSALVPVAVYHAASSSLNPISHHEAARLVNDFYNKHPSGMIKLGRNLKASQVYEPNPWRAKLARRWLSFKVGLVSALLGCVGQDKAARRLRLGHLNFMQQVQTDKNNHRLFFDVSHALALERLMSAEELADFPVVWRGDWARYGHTYMAAVVKLFLGKPAPKSSDHDFVHIPSRHVA